MFYDAGLDTTPFRGSGTVSGRKVKEKKASAIRYLCRRGGSGGGRDTAMRHLIRLVTRFVPRPAMQRAAFLFLRAVAPFCRGRRYVDPIDGSRYRRLLPYGRDKARANALAPRSASLERHRAIWIFAQRRGLLEPPTRSLLHIAPERCFIKPLRAALGTEYVTADLESPWADLHFDLRQIPFPDNHFDAVMCNHVLEHIPDDAQCMAEMLRVLRPGGWGIFQVPLRWDMATAEDPAVTTPAERERLYGQRDHVRQYGRDYPDRLRRAGFEVEAADICAEIGPEATQRHALLPDEKIIFCRKPAQG